MDGYIESYEQDRKIGGIAKLALGIILLISGAAIMFFPPKIMGEFVDLVGMAVNLAGVALLFSFVTNDSEYVFPPKHHQRQ